MRWILRFRVYIIIFLAVVLISAAVIFSVLRAVLPHATGYKNEIQREISRQIELPVEIDSIDAAIHWFSPRLRLIDVTIYDKRNKVPLFNFKEAFVELDVIASILHGEFIVDDVGLVGTDLSIEKLSENEWSVQGVKITSEGSSELPDAFLYMLQNSDYLLHDSNIYYRDHTGNKLSLNLLDVNIDVKNNFNNHDIKFSMNLPDEFGHDLAVVANLSGDFDSLDGDVFIEANQVKVEQWNKKFNLLPDYQIDTSLDINLWLSVDNNNIETLIAQFIARKLSIKNNATTKSWKTDFLSTSIRYVKQKEHWNVAVSDFYFGEDSKPVWPTAASIIASEDDENYYLSADFLRVVDLQDVAQVLLGKERQPEFNKLQAYKLQGDIYNLDLRLPKKISEQKKQGETLANKNLLSKDLPSKELPNLKQQDKQSKNKQPNKELAVNELLDKLYLQVSVNDFSLQDDKGEIHLAGLDAFLLYENRQAMLDLVSQDIKVEIHKLLRGPLFADTLQGQINLNYDDTGWTLSSEQLQLKNKHINTFSRLDIRSSTAEDIFFDVQTDFYDAYGKYARYYLPVGVMSSALVDWLDMAVTDGYVSSGQFILHGNLDSFPYDNSDGVFQVLFFPGNVNMRFLEDWPLINDVSASVKFNNKSLVVKNARGITLGASLFNGHAEIPDLMNSYLTVKTDARSKNENVQSYIWKSPLDDILGDAMRLFQFSGESDLNLKIDVPISDDNIEVAIEGHLKLNNTEIYYPALGYELTDINGMIDFTEDSIFADSMQAKIQDKSVSINAFTRDGRSGREVVYHLDGEIQADYLLQLYTWIPENWISGNSMWSLDIEVPYQPENYLIHVKANSYLEGVAIQLSDKVQKPSASRMSFSTAIDILDKNGLHVDAKAYLIDAAEAQTDNIFELYAVRDDNHVWKFDIDSGYMAGKGSFTEGLDKDTEVKLNLENIDLHALFYTENKQESEPLKPDDFPPLSWRFKKMLWDDWTFTDVVLETDWHKHGMLINKFSLKGPAMTFNARGTWLKSWTGSQETVLQGTMKSNNFGDTLTGLGFQRSVDRGKFKATFNSKWPAAPYGLSWANMKGKTSFEMENGEIMEVNPGAGGRLLGLLNIFKLTSRLAFDFDDVTRKGFSFDSIKGEFEFVNGDGSLKNFDVSAAAADVNMFGSIDLIKQDYGLLMRVKPHTDTLTFAGGVLLGGVAVGAGLALIQKVFDLGVIGHNVYSITGSWDDPEIEKIVERTTDATEDDDF
ncbi:MAG: YhdP family protein [Gammaproteobacteria bacterium]